MKFGLSNETIAAICSVFKKYPQIDTAILYGSRAKGTYRPGSDIDLTLKGTGLDLRLISEIGNSLDDLMTPYKFDISVFDQIENDDLLKHIARVGVVFYSRSPLN